MTSTIKLSFIRNLLHPSLNPLRCKFNSSFPKLSLSRLPSFSFQISTQASLRCLLSHSTKTNLVTLLLVLVLVLYLRLFKLLRLLTLLLALLSHPKMPLYRLQHPPSPLPRPSLLPVSSLHQFILDGCLLMPIGSRLLRPCFRDPTRVTRSLLTGRSYSQSQWYSLSKSSLSQ